MNTENLYDLIIIGAGPTGLNCAIAASKHGLNYFVVERGLLVNSLYHFPTNMTFFSTSKKLEIGEIPFISHSDKPTRKEALEYYRRIVENYNIAIQYDITAISLEQSDTYHCLKTTKGNIYAKYIIISTGFYGTPRKLNIPGENLPKVKHYYDEAHPYIGRKIVVVGGANSACDVALETWQKGADVTMVVRQKELYHKVKYWILPNIQNRIKEGSIMAYFNSTIQEITKDKIHIKTPDGDIALENDFVLAMTGYTPDYTFLKNIGIKIENDAYQTPNYNPTTLESNINRVYLAGVILGGLNTSKYFIENTRDQANTIMESILKSH